MADFDSIVGGSLTGQTVNRAYVPNAQTINNTLPADVFTGLLTPSAQSPGAGAHEATGEGGRSTPIIDFPCRDDPGPQLYWFERVHSFPPFFELGNIITTITRNLEIYNAYRESARTLSVFTNNADSGVTLVGFPGLPTDISQNNGLECDVQISTEGPPTLDGTLDFTLDVDLPASRLKGVGGQGLQNAFTAVMGGRDAIVPLRIRVGGTTESPSITGGVRAEARKRIQQETKKRIKTRATDLLKGLF